MRELSVYDGETLESVVAITDQGDYVRVNDFETVAKKPATEGDDDDDNSMRLYNSLYETALKQDIPRAIIDDLIRIFANDVDLQRAVASGNSFEALYDNGDAEHREELLYASITARNETFRYYRFQTPDDGVIDFYDQSGKSSRKFLMRVPVIGAKMTSGFGARFHPILGYTRMHTGTDFAASIGTPVFAAGNGTISRSAGIRAMAGASRSSTPTAMRRPITISRPLPAASRKASGSGKARSSAISAKAASRRDRISTTKCWSMAISSTRCG